MISRKKYKSPYLEIDEMTDVDVITASPFGENKDDGQGEWDKTEGGDGIW